MQRPLEMPVSNRLVTAEEFERMPEEPGVRMELVRGRVVRMIAPGPRHGWIAMRLGTMLTQHVEANDLGAVLDPSGFKLETNPDTVRIPDLAFIGRNRIPPGGLTDTFLDKPDLAVEILSPNDRPGAVRAKIDYYLGKGVRTVWVTDPKQEIVTVYESGSEPLTLREGGVLDGGDVIPGFRCDIGRIFHSKS